MCGCVGVFCVGVCVCVCYEGCKSEAFAEAFAGLRHLEFGIPK